MTDIHILYDITSQADYDIVSSWASQLKKSGKKVYTLGFARSPGLKPAENDNIYTLKEVGYNFSPKSAKAKEFLSTHADVLVVLCHQFHLHMKYMTFAHDSYFKIGLKFPNSETYFHMTVDTDTDAEYNQVIQNIVMSINKLSNN